MHPGSQQGVHPGRQQAKEVVVQRNDVNSAFEILLEEIELVANTI